MKSVNMRLIGEICVTGGIGGTGGEIGGTGGEICGTDNSLLSKEAGGGPAKKVLN